MGIYLVQAAKRPAQLPPLSDALESRSQRLADMATSWNTDPLFGDIRRWLAEQPTPRAIPSFESSVTGTVVAELSEDEAERLPREVRGARVSPDHPIGLIRNRHYEGTDKPDIDEMDLWHLASIGLTAKRSSGTFSATGKGVTVAVLDTGIDDSHPELTGKVPEAFTFDPTTGQAVSMSPPGDTDGHGTVIAGLLCGSRIGVAPEARIVSGVMLPRGLGNASDFVRALNWVITRTDVRIVNVSAGILGVDGTMLNSVAAVFAAGILPVFATGDAGASGQTYSPGNYDLPLSVGASTEKGRVAVFSSGGTMTMGQTTLFTVPDLVAPGEQVWSSVRGGGYAVFDGTSLSAPIVSGIAALIVEKHPMISVADLMQQLLDSCKDLRRPSDRQGHGLVQVLP